MYKPEFLEIFLKIRAYMFCLLFKIFKIKQILKTSEVFIGHFTN